MFECIFDTFKKSDFSFKSLFVETEPAMSYQMYRITTLGEALEQTLNELQEEGHIPKEIIPRVMAVFDRCINHALSNRLRNKTTFKASYKIKAFNSF